MMQSLKMLMVCQVAANRLRVHPLRKQSKFSNLNKSPKKLLTKKNLVKKKLVRRVRELWLLLSPKIGIPNLTSYQKHRFWKG